MLTTPKPDKSLDGKPRGRGGGGKVASIKDGVAGSIPGAQPEET